MAWLLAFLLLFSMEGWLIRAVEYKLDGKSYIVYSTSARTFSKTYSTIHMLFRMTEPSGILLHAQGTSGDFITLEIVRGKLRYASVFGQGSARPGFHDVIVGDDLGDDQWHQIDIERDQNHVVIKLDITRKYLTADRVKKYQNINQDITVAALSPSIPINSSIPPVSLTGSIFKGCMEDATFNKINIFTAAKAKSKYVLVLGDLRPRCADDAEYYPPATLAETTSFIKVAIVNGQGVDLGFKFRTFDHSGVIVHYSFGLNKTETVFLELVQGKLRLNYGGHNLNITTIIAPKYSTFADGLWHKVRFNLTIKRVAIQVNNDTTKTFLNASGIRDFLKNPTLKIGSSFSGKSSMKGCVREIKLNGKGVDVTRSMCQDVALDQCYLNDLCFINPCLHQGVCKQHNNTMRCDCADTGYQGLCCENISNSANYNITSSTQNTPSYVKAKTSSIVSTIIRPSQITAEFIKTISSSIKLGSPRGPSTSSTLKLPYTFPSSSKHYQQKLPMIRPSHSVTSDSSVSPSTSSTEKLPIMLPSSSKPETMHTTRGINPKFLRIPSQTSTAKPNQDTTRSEKISANKPDQSITPIPMHTSATILEQIITPTLPSRRVLTARSKEATTIITKHTSSPQLKQPSITTQISPASTTKSRSTTPPPTNSLRPTSPTEQKPTYPINTQIIIIEKSNTINTGFNKNQLLVYLFLFLVFMLFVGLIIIISVKLGSFQACSCFRRHQTDNGSLTSQDEIELGQQESKESSRGVNQRRVKSGRPSSLNDSGIDRSESGTDSNRSSAEMQDEAISNCADLETRIEDASSEGFLVLQEDPSLYTQQSFGWTVLDSSSTIRHCRTSTRDLIHAVNENKPRAFRPAYYPNSGEDDVIDDVTVTSETRCRNPTTKYRQLATSDCSSLDNVSIDFEPGSTQGQGNCGETMEECPVF